MIAHLSSSSTAVSPVSRSRPDALEQRLHKIVEAGPVAIDARLAELDSEWTAGRAAQGTAGVLLLAGLALGLAVNPWWFVLPIATASLLAPLAFGRRSLLGEMFHAAGFRSGVEIDREKLALRALRGDFRNLPTVHQIEDPEALTRMEGEGGIVYEPDYDKVDARSAVKEVIVVACR